MKFSRFALFALLTAGAISTGTAGILTYTDQSAFLTALAPGYFLDDFAGVPNGGINGVSSTRSGNGFSVTYTAPEGGLFSVPGAMSTSSATDNLVATMGGNSIFAFGWNSYLTDFNGTFQPFVGTTVTAFATNGIDPDSPLSASVNATSIFFGWISTTPITSITMNSGAGGGTPKFNTMDNIIVGVAAPEPGTFGMLALGATGLILARLRRK
ncbi:MAG: PEP-CTERM sorting domain-containing protein [Verrucomicrobiota bacterium]